jgi:molybdate transport system ATP-binding protein
MKAPRIDLSIHHPETGGHIFLGKNGIGKTEISQILVSFGETLIDGHLSSDLFPSSVAHVSFQSHYDLLQQGCTAYKAISGGSNKLNKAAQFLVVRFGLYSLLHREVHTLSTGEIRKTMLVKALAQRPRLLILDNAFDGLDVVSRESLKDLVARTLRGFRPDVLVQGIDAKATAHTQILLLTHRPEEIVDEIEHVSFWRRDGLFTTVSREERDGHELFQIALGLEDTSELDSSLPSSDIIQTWWQERDGGLHFANKPPVYASGLTVKRGDSTILHGLDWRVEAGHRWLIAGGNGAGKSSLSRLLARDEDHNTTGTLNVPGREHNGWCSTELHMQLGKSDGQVSDFLPASSPVGEWLCVDHLMDRKFAFLSQGQQKMVLIAASIAKRPNLLVLDEPLQGLDLINRLKVLQLVDRICSVTDMSLVYITHHLEELVPSITHILHLKNGRATYNGTRDRYDPVNAENSIK